MYKVCVYENPSNVLEFTTYGHKGEFIDFIVKTFPPDAGGFNGRNGVCYYDEEIIPLDDWDFTPEDGSTVHLVLFPGTGYDVAVIAIKIIISLAISAIANKLLEKPEQPSPATAPKPSPIFSVSVPENKARLGEAIPVIYGELTTTPDLASQPYTYFDQNQEYAAILLCIGQGDYIVDDVLAGESSFSSIPEDIWEYKVYGPDDHNQNHGTIQSDFGIAEDMITAPEVSDALLDPAPETDSDTYATVFPNSTTIRVYTNDPDVAGFVSGSSVTLANAAPNNGTYSISGVSTSTTAAGLVYVDLTTTGLTSDTIAYGNSFRGDISAGSNPDILNVVCTTNDDFVTLDVGDVVRVDLGSNSVIGKITNINYNTKIGFEGEIDFYISDVRVRIQSGTFPGDGFGDIKKVTTTALIASDYEPYVGWFVTNKPETEVNQLSYDFQWPSGLYGSDTSGTLVDETVDIDIEYQRLDDEGNPTGSITTESFSFSTSDVQPGVSKNTPKRYTHVINLSTSGRYRTRVIRTDTAPTESNAQTRTVWTGLKARKVLTSSPVYGDVTLLALKLKSSSGLARNAINRVRTRVRRFLPFIRNYNENNTSFLRSPSRALSDILQNNTYGAGLSSSYLDINELASISSTWNTNGIYFDHVFDQQNTLWEACRIALQPALAYPIIVDGKVTAAQEGPKAVRTQLFTPNNILEGSLKMSYVFKGNDDFNGIKVVYRDQDTLSERFEIFPSTATRFEEYRIYGLVSQSVAQDIAKIRWRQVTNSRSVIEFETEFEGRIPRRGDLISVFHPLFATGGHGIVETINSSTQYVLDRDLQEIPTNPYAVFRRFDGSASGLVFVNSISGRTINLASGPGITVTQIGDNRKDPTYVVVGRQQDFLMDFLVNTVETSGKFFRITGKAYNEDNYAGTVFNNVVT